MASKIAPRAVWGWATQLIRRVLNPGPGLWKEAPDFELPQLGGNGRLRLSFFRGKKPVLLIFGSLTCPTFRGSARRINAICGSLKDRIQPLVVYIRESHPADGWQIPENERDGVKVRQTCSWAARERAAKLCQDELKLQAPVLVDAPDNPTERTYAALPERVYLVDERGKVAYKGKPGPWGYDLDEVEWALRQFLRNEGLRR